MAAEMVYQATSKKLKEMNWMRNIEICEHVARDPGKAKDVIKSLKKQLKNKHVSSQLYAVMSIGVQLPQHRHVATPETPDPMVQMESMLTDKIHLQKHGNCGNESTTQLIVNSSIIQKASNILEVLRDALNALGSKLPEEAMDEFVLDLVEQCAFQKQKIMHLAMTSRDEKVVTEAIELNDQLHQVLTRHDALLSVQPTTATNLSKREEEEEEEDAQRLYQRKSLCEEDPEQSVGSFRSIPRERIHRPLIRPPLPSDHEDRPRPLIIEPSDPENGKQRFFSRPPPPTKHLEREIFFRDQSIDGLGLAVHVRGLSLHSSDGSSSGSGITDCNEPHSYDFRN